MRLIRSSLFIACTLLQVFAFSSVWAASTITGTCVTSGKTCTPAGVPNAQPCAANDTCKYSAGICSGGTDSSKPVGQQSLDSLPCLKQSDCGTGGVCQYNDECFPNQTTCTQICTTGSTKATGSLATSDPPVNLHCQAGAHLCYCKGAPYTLEIPLGANTTVSGIGNYIQTLYTFLLGFSIVIAIVMVMIGGIQYVLAAGSGETKEAKTRMTSAAIGLVLLFCAALILQTVNPQLLNLQPPFLPAIDTIDLGGSSACKAGQCCSYTTQASCIASAANCTWPEGFGTCVASSCTTGCCLYATDETACGQHGCLWTGSNPVKGSSISCVDLVNSGQNGSQCTPPNNTCATGLKCIQQVTISNPRCTDGHTGSPCAGDSDCIDANTSCDDGLCIASTNKPNGASCSANSDCQSGVCGTGGICKLGAVGNVCSLDSDCQSTSYCTTEFPYLCTAKQGSSTACAADDQCTSGNCKGTALGLTSGTCQ